MRFFLVLIFFFFLANKGSTQTIDFEQMPIATMCGADAGSALLTFKVSSTFSDVSITCYVYRKGKINDELIIGKAYDNGFSFSEIINVLPTDELFIEVFTNPDRITTTVRINLYVRPPTPSISASSTLLCNGATSILTANGSGNTINWPIGATPTSATTATVVTAGSYAITETNACFTSEPSNTIVITAISTPSAPTASASSSLLCDGASAILTATGSGGTYNWSNAASGVTTSVTAAGSYYVTETNSCGTSPSSNIVTITTNTTPSVAPITGTTTICPSKTSQLANATLGGTWSSLDLTKATINTAGLVTGVKTGNVTIKYTLSNSCGIGSAEKNITISSGVPSIPTITTAKTLLCNGEATTLTSTNAGDGGILIWSNGDNGTTTSVTTASDYKVYELNSCGQSNFSNIIKITTLSNPSVAAITGNTDVCVGSQIILSNVTSGGTWTSLETTKATINTTGVVLGVGSGSTTINYALSNTCGTTTVSKIVKINALPILNAIGGLSNICTNAVYPYTNDQIGGIWSVSNASVSSVNTSGQVTTKSFGTSTLTYSYTDGNNCATSITKALTINALPIVNISSAIVGSNVELIGTGATLYNWSSGETTANIQKAVSISNIYAVTGTDGNGCQSSKSFTVDAAPNASTTAITSSLGNTFCTSANTVLTLSAGNGYYWNTGENTRTLTTSAIGTYIGYVLYSVNYKVEAANIILSNYAIPTVTAINSTNSLAYCNGVAAPTLTFNGPVSGTSFSWTNDNTTVGVAGNGSNSISSFTASNTTNVPIMASFSVVPKANGCVGTTYNFTTTINPTPNLLTTKSYTICNKASNPIALTSNVVGATYNWSRSVNANIQNSVTTSSTAIIDELLENIIRDNTTATYSVETSAYGCSTTTPISVLVHPKVSADQLNTLAYCNGVQPGILTFTGWANGSTYSWTNDNTAIGVIGNGTNNIPNYVATNLGGDAIQSNISVVPTANGCTGPTMNFKIIVNPTPNLLTTKTYDICNEASNQIALTSNVNYATYQWSRGAISSIENATTSGTTNLINENLKNIIKDNTTAIYSVITSANNCSTTTPISVLVHPTVKVDNVSDITYCNGVVAPTLTFSGFANNSTYSWTNDNKAIGVLLSGTNSITSYTASNTTGDIVQSNISVAPSANGCTGPTMNFKIIVNPTPKLTSIKEMNICDEGTLQYVPKSNVNAKYEVLWAVKKEDSTSVENTPTSGTFSTKLKNSAQTIKKVQFIGTLSSLGCINNDTLIVKVIPKPFGTLTAKYDTVLSGKLNTFKFVTSDTIARMNTWDLGFNMPKFKISKDSYDMEYYYNKDTMNVISVMPINRYGCFNVFSKTIYIEGVPLVIPKYDTIPNQITDNESWENTLIPVPFNDILSFRYHLDQDEEATFSFFDPIGFPVYSVKVKMYKGNHKIAIPEQWRLSKNIIYTFICISKSIKHKQRFYGVSGSINF